MSPTKRVTNLLKFQLERLLLRGPQYRLLVVALLVVGVAAAGGVLVQILAQGFGSMGEAVWWAFLRLTDPGYLGDDEGAARRAVSTAVTIIGYVIFMGALIAIMTQWFHATMDRLGKGLTPIVANNHVVVLGWSHRTPTVVEQLILSEGRLRRFLQRIGEKQLTVAILAEEVGPNIIQELKGRLGPRWDPRRIILRSGSPLRLEHLRRVDFLHASVVIMPGEELEGAEGSTADSRAIKTLLSIGTTTRESGAEELPLMVAELSDSRNVPIAKRAYGGPIEVLSSDRILSRLLAQTVRNPGLSHVFNELLTRGEAGNELYVRDAPSLVGRRFIDLVDGFPEAVPVGLARSREGELETLLCPEGAVEVQPEDRVVVVAPSYQASLPATAREARPLAARERDEGPADIPRARRLLVLGWNKKVPSLIREIDAYDDEDVAVDVLSLVPPPEREIDVERQGCTPERIDLRQLAGEYTSPSELARLEPGSYDTVLVVASDWLDTEHDSDARTVLGYLVLEEVLHACQARPQIIIELAAAENATLFETRQVEVVVSPVILSHVVTQVAIRKELGTVFDDLFGPGGAQLSFRPVGDYGLLYRAVGFDDVLRAAAARGHVALGLRFAAEATGSGGGVVLNPPRGERQELGREDELVVLMNSAHQARRREPPGNERRY